MENKTTTFVYDPNFDYYELFELYMSDGTLDELLEDPEDYCEFIEALKAGKFSL